MPISFRCICTVDHRRLAEETSCGDSVRSYSNRTAVSRWGACSGLVNKGSHFVALLRRVFHGANGHRRPGAFRVRRGQTPRAGHA